METAQSFDRIKKKHGGFQNPSIKIKIAGKELTAEKNVVITEAEVELTFGFDASAATFTAVMRDKFHKGEFNNGLIDTYLVLGAKAQILLGYDDKAKDVFVGYIADVSYRFAEDSPLSVTVACLDAKGLMMNNKSSIQRTEDSYDKCVRTIANNYKSCIDKITVESSEKRDRKIEMTDTSDYEFIMSAAKRLGYKFYIRGGEMFFRPAESGSKLTLILNQDSAAEFFEVRYTLAGLAKAVEIRSTDDGKAKEIAGTAQTNAKFSRGGHASKAISTAKRVFIDETAASQQEAENLAKIKLEAINRRFGILKWKTNGIPELFPGDEVKLEFEAKDLAKTFQISLVRHTLLQEQFVTYLEGELKSL